MTNLQFLLAITFVYGVLRLLTHTKLFNTVLVGILESIFTKPNQKTLFGALIMIIDICFFYFSLVFQAWWWLFK
jgi:hypothetical protein